MEAVVLMPALRNAFGRTWDEDRAMVVLLNWPLQKFLPSQRLTNVRVNILLRSWLKPELRIPIAAAQTRMVSMAGIRLRSWESARAFKGIICDDISEIAVGTLIT
jgi:hypothetical protein